jgi:uncharacterized protein (DUF1330 family)
MTAYIIADIDIHDAEGYQEYRQLAPATIAAYGGKYVVRAGQVEIVEGDWIPKRLVMLEFETMEQARAWLTSEQYLAVKSIRHRTAESNIILVEGATPVS